MSKKPGFTEAQLLLYSVSRIVTTDTGAVVPGTTAKFVVTPVTKSVSKKAKASAKVHWKVPYSSEANKKLKLINSFKLVKSNSSFDAFFEFIAVPVAVKIIFSSWESPVQVVEPSLKMDVFGPGTLFTFPVERTIPDDNGKVGFVFVKYPIPLVEPKFVPVLEVTLEIVIHGLFTNTFVTNCSFVYVVEFVTKKLNIEINEENQKLILDEFYPDIEDKIHWYFLEYRLYEGIITKDEYEKIKALPQDTYIYFGSVAKYVDDECELNELNLVMI